LVKDERKKAGVELEGKEERGKTEIELKEGKENK
jgi:hypothetical protein